MAYGAHAHLGYRLLGPSRHVRASNTVGADTFCITAVHFIPIVGVGKERHIQIMVHGET